MKPLLETLVERDDLYPAEAQEQIERAKDALQEYLGDGELSLAHNVCEEFFALEPDYLTYLMD